MKQYRKRRISPEFKNEAIKIINTEDVEIWELARYMNISESTLRRWKRKLEAEGTNAFKSEDAPNKVYSFLFGGAEEAWLWYGLGQSKRLIDGVIKNLELLIEEDFSPNDLSLNNSANYPQVKDNRGIC